MVDEESAWSGDESDSEDEERGDLLARGVAMSLDLKDRQGLGDSDDDELETAIEVLAEEEEDAWCGSL